MKLPTRKKNRLSNYDYNSIGVYFITICTTDRKCIFWKDYHFSTDAVSGNSVGASIARQQEHLSSYGQVVLSAIKNIPTYYPCVNVDNYAIMPNHVHLLLSLNEAGGRAMLAPTISTVVAQTKGFVTKQLGFSIWQKTFHDHIVRNQNDYDSIWQYIQDNPFKWDEDEFFIVD